MESKLLIKFDKSPDLKIWAITCMLLRDLGAKVNKCGKINEYINCFCNVGQDHFLTLNQHLS